ncbi:uncharacterized protein CANTADRAFT_51664 [Suhomyces tanzawaensis NRRL Y-17324]|uniref:Pyridoxamine 5'-phosphate oxidase N-terminal domain-containing protein n=1 Tax=Suhomyces tanzawaensis NRRL Y-17324 TaxID=984487 RepID=A0A1E4SI69_9ASCO|nr:uncharacterized protein CANTADRAFT_51664 [Suhomyces tanzawaensis NRRL Y-17324]ODV79137.1 hypothetical protein CANTADRAFT_51664 [Suhomyces tanzawaensis NRRL Y-17324]
MSELPGSVTNLLKSTRFIHLATCKDNVPHVSLMNYTYYHGSEGDYIIISTPKKTTKYENIVANPIVSLLVHDWISAKDNNSGEDKSGAPNERRNSLFEMLANINKNELGRVSVMITGTSTILDKEKDATSFEFYKSLHLNNSKIDQVQSKNYIECDGNALIAIKFDSVKVTDTDNNIELY